MTTLTLILTIAAIDFLSILTPGQDFAIVTRNTLKHSKKAGYWTIAGIGFVTLCHCLLAMTGLSLIISQTPDLLAIIKTIGALYLVYLGGHFFKNARNLEIKNTQSKPNKPLNPTKAFKMGAIANVFNIEPIMAFVSIFAIVLPADTALSIKLIICLLLPINTMIWLGVVANLFSLKSIQIFCSARMKQLEQAIGIILVFFGSKTLIEIKKS